MYKIALIDGEQHVVLDEPSLNSWMLDNIPFRAFSITWYNDGHGEIDVRQNKYDTAPIFGTITPL